MASELQVLTVNRHQVVESPRGPVLTDRRDALRQQPQDGLKRPERSKSDSAGRTRTTPPHKRVPLRNDTCTQTVPTATRREHAEVTCS